MKSVAYPVPARRTLAALLLPLLLQACFDPSAEEHVAKARELLARQDAAGATLALKSALQADERRADARLLLGRAYLQAGDAAAAEQELMRAEERGAKAADVAPWLAQALLARGQHAKLLQRFANTAPPQGEDGTELLMAVAQAHLAQQEVEQARKAAEAARANTPQAVQPRVLLAQMQALDGDRPAALAALDALLQEQPKAAAAWLAKADLLAATPGQGDAAQQAYQQALAAEPKLRAAYAGLLGLALRDGRAEDARRLMDDLRKVAPGDPRSLALQVRVSLLLNDAPGAHEAAQQLLRRAPEDAQALLLAGEAAWRAGSRQAALAHLGKALAAMPGLRPARVMLARVQLENGDPATTLKTLASLLGQDPPPPEALAAAAEAELTQGHWAQAQAYYKRAAAGRPQDLRLKVAALLSQDPMGSKPATLAELTQLAQRDPTGLAWQALARLQAAQGRLQDAAQSARQAAEHDPKNPRPAQLQADLLLRQGDLAAARGALEQALSRDPQYLPALNRLGELDIRDKQTARALERVHAVVKSHPSLVGPRLTLARLQNLAGESTQTVRGTLVDAAKVDRQSTAALLALGWHDLEYGREADALQTAQSARTAFPDDADVLHLLARAQRASGQGGQALRSFEQLVVARPNQPAPLLELAAEQRLAKQTAAALKTLDAVQRLAPESQDVRRMRLEIAVDNKDWAGALKMAAAEQQRLPKQPQGWQWAGAVEAAQARWPAAIAAYRESLARGAGTDAAVRLHMAYLRAGQDDQAAQHGQAWMDKHPQDIAMRMHLGDACASRRDFTCAEGHYRVAAVQAPNHMLAQNNLAYSQAQLKQPEAVATARRALELSPGHAEALDTLATALESQGQGADALEAQKKAVAAAPRRWDVRLHLAQLAERQGDRSLARTELQKTLDLRSDLAQDRAVLDLQQRLR